MSQPSRAGAIEFAREDALDAIEYARKQANPGWAVVAIADGLDRGGWPQTKFHHHWWQLQDQGWPGELQDAYIDAFLLEMTQANFAAIELLHSQGMKKWTSIGVVDLDAWEAEFPFEPGRWVRQEYGSTKGWKRKSALRKLPRRLRRKSSG